MVLKKDRDGGIPGLSADYARLLEKVRGVLVEGQRRIDAERVRTYWEAGREIDAHILKYERGERGKEVILRLARDLKVDDTLLNRCVRFARLYPALGKSAGWQKFSWSHYRELITVSDDKKRLTFEKTAAHKGWSADELAARIKDGKVVLKDSADKHPARRPSASKEFKPLVPQRGIVNTFRVVERPGITQDAVSGLLIDLGFGIFHDPDGRLPAGSHADDIIELLPGRGRTIAKSARTAKDLYTYEAFVEKVIDGDTVKVRLDLGFGTWTRQTLRLRGIDCPELSTSAGDEARSFARSYLKEAGRIIVRSSRSDKYDRYLADVFIPADADQPSTINEQRLTSNEIYLNNLLLETGRAVFWTA